MLVKSETWGEMETPNACIVVGQGFCVVNVQGRWVLVVASERFEDPPSKKNRKKNKEKKTNKTKISKKHSEMITFSSCLWVGDGIPNGGLRPCL